MRKPNATVNGLGPAMLSVFEETRDEPEPRQSPPSRSRNKGKGRRDAPGPSMLDDFEREVRKKLLSDGVSLTDVLSLHRIVMCGQTPWN